MSKRRRRDRGKRRTHRTPPPQPARGEPDLISDVTATLESGHRLELLALVSSLLAAVDPRSHAPFDRSPPHITRDDLVQTFFEVDHPATSALLSVAAALSDDEVLARRARHEVAAREHALPDWVADLHLAELATRVVEIVHVLGDGENIMVGIQLPGAHDLTAVVYIDHNIGTIVKDAFVVDAALPGLVGQMLAVGEDPDNTEARDLDPATARARIADAIEKGAITFPPPESDSWPACRPLVEWIVRKLPAGGTGYEYREWSDAELAELTERFLGSPFGGGFDDADHRGLLEDLLWYGTDYAPGHPLRWSPVTVEILLVDWIPRKIVAETPYLAKAPDLVRAFIRFAHHERGIDATLTEQTLAAVDEYEPGYQEAIRSARLQGPEALLARLGAIDVNVPFEARFPEYYLRELGRTVGGEAALDALDTAPLPDEPFDWQPVPADVHERVAEVLALVDRCCDELFFVEFRTACRRFLSRVAAGDPAIFRRRGRAHTAAAAVCWVIAKANDLLSPDELQSQELLGHFGLRPGSVSQRSQPMLQAIGVDPHDQFGGMDLGSPDYLTGTRRLEITSIRDAYRREQAQ